MREIEVLTVSAEEAPDGAQSSGATASRSPTPITTSMPAA